MLAFYMCFNETGICCDLNLYVAVHTSVLSRHGSSDENNLRRNQWNIVFPAHIDPFYCTRYFDRCKQKLQTFFIDKTFNKLCVQINECHSTYMACLHLLSMGRGAMARAPDCLASHAYVLVSNPPVFRVRFSKKQQCFSLLNVTRQSRQWRPRRVKVETSVST